MKSLDEYKNEQAAIRRRIAEIKLSAGKYDKLSDVIIPLSFVIFLAATFFLANAVDSFQGNLAIAFIVLSIFMMVLPIYLSKLDKNHKKKLLEKEFPDLYLSKKTLQNNKTVKLNLKTPRNLTPEQLETVKEIENAYIDFEKKPMITPTPTATPGYFNKKREEIIKSDNYTNESKKILVKNLKESERITTSRFGSSPVIPNWLAWIVIIFFLWSIYNGATST